jgi:hypothetical protein
MVGMGEQRPRDGSPGGHLFARAMVSFVAPSARAASSAARSDEKPARCARAFMQNHVDGFSSAAITGLSPAISSATTTSTTQPKRDTSQQVTQPAAKTPSNHDQKTNAGSQGDIQPGAGHWIETRSAHTAATGPMPIRSVMPIARSAPVADFNAHFHLANMRLACRQLQPPQYSGWRLQAGR